MYRTAPFLLAALFLGACGSDADQPSATPGVVDGDQDTEGAAVGEAADDPAASDEDAALAFAGCMRDEGVDFGDPTVAADGSVDFSQSLPDGVGIGNAGQLRDAYRACGDLLADTSLLPTDEDLVENEDALLAFAQCLRDEGIDVDDPQLDSIDDLSGNPFGPGFDPDDPATREATEVCRPALAEVRTGNDR